MATHKSAMKRNRQNRKIRARNRQYRTQMKTCVKKVRQAVEEKDAEKARAALKEAVPIIDKVSGKGLVHKRNAARKVSKLTRLVNSLG